MLFDHTQEAELSELRFGLVG